MRNRITAIFVLAITMTAGVLWLQPRVPKRPPTVKTPHESQSAPLTNIEEKLAAIQEPDSSITDSNLARVKEVAGFFGGYQRQHFRDLCSQSPEALLHQYWTNITNAEVGSDLYFIRAAMAQSLRRNPSSMPFVLDSLEQTLASTNQTQSARIAAVFALKEISAADASVLLAEVFASSESSQRLQRASSDAFLALTKTAQWSDQVRSDINTSLWQLMENHPPADTARTLLLGIAQIGDPEGIKSIYGKLVEYESAGVTPDKMQPTEKAWLDAAINVRTTFCLDVLSEQLKAPTDAPPLRQMAAAGALLGAGQPEALDELGKWITTASAPIGLPLIQLMEQINTEGRLEYFEELAKNGGNFTNPENLVALKQGLQYPEDRIATVMKSLKEDKTGEMKPAASQ